MALLFFGKCCNDVDPTEKCGVMSMNCPADGNVSSAQFSSIFTGNLVYADVYSSLTANNCELEVTYPAGQIGGSSAVGGEWTFQDQSQVRWLSYCVEFDNDFEFVLGGKLPGLGGGSTPSGGINSQAEICSGYSLRLMWGGGTGDPNMIGYLYYAGMPNNFPGTTYAQELDLGFIPQQGTKYCITMGVDVGTAGNNDGSINIYVDGVLRYTQSNMNFICAGENWENDAFMFSTFYGGGTQDWAPQNDNTATFSNFCVGNTKNEVN